MYSNFKLKKLVVSLVLHSFKKFCNFKVNGQNSQGFVVDLGEEKNLLGFRVKNDRNIPSNNR